MPIEVFGQEKVERPVYVSDKKKTRFVDLTSTATIRILTKERTVVDSHFISSSKATVRCLGEECPICASNRNLIIQFPKDFRDEPHYSPRRQVKLVNVLDKTPVRTCGKCSHEEKTSQTCSSCKEIISSELKPSDTVKVLSRGVTLYDSLDAIDNAVLDAKGEKVGITNYDITLVVSGTGKNRTTTPIVGQVLPIREVAPDELFDLETITIEVTPNEMLDLQRGVSLRDVFSARRATAKQESEADPFVSKELMDSVTADVEALFS